MRTTRALRKWKECKLSFLKCWYNNVPVTNFTDLKTIRLTKRIRICSIASRGARARRRRTKWRRDIQWGHLLPNWIGSRYVKFSCWFHNGRTSSIINRALSGWKILNAEFNRCTWNDVCFKSAAVKAFLFRSFSVVKDQHFLWACWSAPARNIEIPWNRDSWIFDYSTSSYNIYGTQLSTSS